MNVIDVLRAAEGALSNIGDKGNEACAAIAREARAALAAHDAAVSSGEWSENECSVWDRTGRWIADIDGAAKRQRVIACVNALQGIADPAAYIAQLCAPLSCRAESAGEPSRLVAYPLQREDARTVSAMLHAGADACRSFGVLEPDRMRALADDLEQFGGEA